MKRRLHSIDLRTKTVTYVSGPFPSGKQCDASVLRSKTTAEYYNRTAEFLEKLDSTMAPESMISRLCLNQTLQRNARALLDR